MSWLMALSMLLIMALVSIWLVRAYQDEEEGLRKELDFIFSSSIRELEDSLIQQNFFLEPTDMEKVHNSTRINHAAVDDSVKMVAIIQENAPNHDVHQRRIRSLRRNGLKRPNDAFAGALSLHLQMTSGDSLTLASFESNSDFSNLMPFIKGKFEKAYGAAAYPFPYTIHQFEGDLPDQEHTLFSKPYFDVPSGQQFAVSAKSYSTYLLKKLSNEALFSIFLLVVTFLAFLFTYRGMQHHRRLNILKNDLISNITHELKTPISTVSVALEALSNFQAGENPERAKEYLEISRNELDRLSILVDNVLKTSVKEGQVMNLILESLNIKDLIDDILNTMKVHFDKLSAQVHFDYSGTDFHLEGDRLHLTSVVYNLLDNALKYSEKSPSINIKLDQQPTHLNITISDNGLGIAKDDLTKIFDKFFRISNGSQHNVKGYGLGLSYVSQVINQHRGSIKVQSELGQGTTFTIRLPQIHSA
ncbi:MAG: HAMP domain-containing histidine kinase [Saprospiraceae bacterium]|nr:HAMP domain-containing histidine kinase [Saprospiraceae bacterium]